MANIYDFFERGEIKCKIKDERGNDLITYYYKCKICLSKFDEEKKAKYNGITANRRTNSNLHTHLAIDCPLHQKAKREYYESQEKLKENRTPINHKRRLIQEDEINEEPSTPKRTLLNMNAISRTPKYPRQSNMQISRFRQLLIMLVRCMLPIYLVEKEPFKKFVEALDPSFHMPTRYTVKKTGLPQLRDEIKNKILNILKKIPWPNIILDGWSDGILRCFTGYIIQGIDENWNLVKYTLAFRQTKGIKVDILFIVL